MAAIFGQCPLCPKKERAQRLYGGLCSYHFTVKPLSNQKPKTELERHIVKPLKKKKND